MPHYRINYSCYHCGHTWNEVYTSACDSECPSCEASDCTPTSWKELPPRPMKKDKFIEEAFEIAFGDNAINRGFKREEVLEKLKEYAETSNKLEEGEC